MIPATPNQSVEFERAALGAALLDPQHALPVVVEQLRPEDFTEPPARLVFVAMRDLYRSDRSVDPLTLRALLEDRQQFNDAGGFAYIAELDQYLPDVSRVAEYVATLRDRSGRRQAIDLAKRLQGEAATTPGPVVELLGRVCRDLERIATRACTVTGEFASLGSRSDALQESISTTRRDVLGIRSGLRDLDARTLGFCPGQLWTIAGRPGSGKTALALQIMRTAAGDEQPSAMVSLEMTQIELAQRQLAAFSGVDHHKIRTGRMSPAERRQAMNFAAGLRDVPIYLDDTATASLFEIAAKARRLKAASGLALLVVDYLQLLDAPIDRRGNRVLEVGDMTRGLKRLALELEIPVLALSQLSRESEKQRRRPMLSDLRDSGSIEQDSNGVIFVHPQADSAPATRSSDEERDGGMVELIVAKNRGGSCGTSEAYFRRTTQVFTDSTHREENAA